MNSEMETGMQEILLDDVDDDSMEFRLLMAFAQRNLSDSRFQELLKKHFTRTGDEKNGKPVEELNGHVGKAGRDLSQNPILTSTSSDSKVEVKKMKKSSWKRWVIPQCIRGERWDKTSTAKGGDQMEKRKRAVPMESETSVEGAFNLDGGDAAQGPDPETVAHIADHLLVILHDAPDYSSDPGYRTMSRSFSVEADGVSDEDALIQGIVAVLRESGDLLEEKIKADKTLQQGISEMFTSYSYFKKVTDLYVGDQVIEEEVEVQQQSVKVAFAMDITTKLTAIDNHPMNKVLGFGVKYLKEKFSPWIKDHGGWEKAFGAVDVEEVD